MKNLFLSIDPNEISEVYEILKNSREDISIILDIKKFYTQEIDESGRNVVLYDEEASQKISDIVRLNKE